MTFRPPWRPADPEPVSYVVIETHEVERAFGICLGCADEDEDRYLDLADCECHERGSD